MPLGENMEINTNDKREMDELVSIEIKISRRQAELMALYSKIARKTPDRLYHRIMSKGIAEIIGAIKALPFSNIDAFKEVMTGIPEHYPTLDEESK